MRTQDQHSQPQKSQDHHSPPPSSAAINPLQHHCAIHPSRHNCNSAMGDPGERWAFLRPWCAPVRGLLSVDTIATGGVPPLRDVGLTVRLPSDQQDAAPPKWRAIRDAMLLLSLVARVDTWALHHVLVTHCDVEDVEKPPRRAAFVEFSEPRLMIEWRTGLVHDESAWFSTVLESFFGDLGAPPSNVHLLSVAARQIAARGVNGHCELFRQRIDIPIALRSWPCKSDQSLKRAWRSMKALRTRYGGWRFPVRALRLTTGMDCAFTLEADKLAIRSHRVDPVMAGAVEDVVTAGGGLALPEISVALEINAQSRDIRAADVAQLGRLMQRVLCNSDCPGDRRAALQSVRLESSDQRGHAHVARICSVIVETQTVRELELKLELCMIEPRARAWLWGWLAYALFARQARARSSITTVRLLKAFITDADADAIAAILSSPDPIYELLGRQSETPATGMLKQGARLSLQPLGEHEHLEAGPTAWTLPADVCGVTVLAGVGNTPDTVHALVPGYGLCEMRREDAISSDNVARQGGALTGLTLRFERQPDAADGLGRLLSLVGSSLTRLDVYLPSEASISMSTILRWCPNLKRLSVGKWGGGAIDAVELVQAHRDSKLQLEELGCSVMDPTALAAELSDPGTRLFKTLKRLDVRLVGPMWRRRREEYPPLRRIIEMINCNRALECLCLAVHPDVHRADGVKKLLRFNNQLLPVAREPLPLPCRLAFLSVFASHLPGAAERASSLPTPALAAVLREFPQVRSVFLLVFEFAATNARRLVHVRRA